MWLSEALLNDMGGVEGGLKECGKPGRIIAYLLVCTMNTAALWVQSEVIKGAKRVTSTVPVAFEFT